jgi:hypothetical protein
MIKYPEKVKLFRQLNYALTHFDEPYNPPRADIIREFQYTKKNRFPEEFHTLFTDLTPEPEEISNRFEKTTKYQINRALDRDNISTKTLDPKTDKQQFYDFYNQFALSKNLSPIPVIETNALIENDLFTIRTADHDGEPIVYHAYVTTRKRARLMYSASLFRNLDDNAYRSLVGRANRLLHWDDIKYFKQEGYLIYDWGGISTDADDTEKQAINKFKEAFGGEAVKEYKSLVPVSWKGWTYLLLKKITGRL